MVGGEIMNDFEHIPKDTDKISKAIRKYQEKQKMIELHLGPFKSQTDDERAEINVFMHYENIITNLQTQHYILTTLKSTDKLTMLAYRVAWISLGAGLISIVGNIFT